MAPWHCPHCGALQAEAARCWVCRRSSTTCSTCVHFRRSLATDVAYCSLDRRRAPLTGRERRGCWSARPADIDPTPVPLPPLPFVPVLRLRGFVPVEEVAALSAPAAVSAPASAAALATPAPRADSQLDVASIVVARDALDAPTSLFGDAEG